MTLLHRCSAALLAVMASSLPAVAQDGGTVNVLVEGTGEQIQISAEDAAQLCDLEGGAAAQGANADIAPSCTISREAAVQAGYVTDTGAGGDSADDESGDDGHGNDADGVDEGNPGNSEGVAGGNGGENGNGSDDDGSDDNGGGNGGGSDDNGGGNGGGSGGNGGSPGGGNGNGGGNG